MKEIKDDSIDLIVTSPPYPMVGMWDELFIDRDSIISDHLQANQGLKAHILMHEQLDQVWEECYRVLRPGGIMCINIGDATRSFGKRFELFSNRSMIINTMLRLGARMLPSIIWRKPSNAPNKFMGSGMLPTSAYVTHEHEDILIFRKGPMRKFNTPDEITCRRQSAYFWEERNQWFSDQWILKGSRQHLKNKASRERSAAYPIELPYRPINMYSVIGDTILDPFLGTGTTSKAALVAGRNSIGYEIDTQLTKGVFTKTPLLKLADDMLHKRFENHLSFIENRLNEKGPDAVKHIHEGYGFPVMTRQEKEIRFPHLTAVKKSKDSAVAVYS